MYILLFFILLFLTFGAFAIIECIWDLAKRAFNSLIDFIVTIIVKIITYIRNK